MSEGSKLAVLLLHLEMNPDELKKFQRDKKTARAEMAHFGLSQKTIKVVIEGDFEQTGKLFKVLAHQAGVGVAVVEPRRRGK